MPEPRSDHAGISSIVEPLAESPSQEYHDDPTLRAPPGMPIPDVRQSIVSFQTEPSSYYTVDENWSAGGPAPQIPDHPAVQKKDTYEDLWSAMTTAPDSAARPMPSPYEQDEGVDAHSAHDIHTDDYDEDDDESRPASSYRMPEPHPQHEPEHDDTTSSSTPRDRYDSSWLARPSPGMPVPAGGLYSTRCPSGRGCETGIRPNGEVATEA